MALITSYTHRPDREISFRSTVECGWTVGTVDGRRILHLETYGSRDRQVQGRGSQFLELDEMAAEALVSLIHAAFPHLR